VIVLEFGKVIADGTPELVRGVASVAMVDFGAGG
jgi:hypothetical protein